MGRILYYDCFSGISGDMNLAALAGLGVPQSHLRSELGKLGLGGWELRFRPDSRNGIGGLRADVLLADDRGPTAGSGQDHDQHHGHGHEHEHEHEHRSYRSIRALIESCLLSPAVKARALDIFERLARAEAAVHGVDPGEVRFHEVGALDSIVDIVGAAVCLDYLKPDRVLASSVELGGGFVRCRHGTIPVPAPAVVELLKGVPIKSGAAPYETTTPTGAAILASVVDEFTDDKRLSVEAVAYGVGHREMEIPNLLRVLLGSGVGAPAPSPERGVVLECNVDDMNPELHGHVLELLLAAGAQDAWITPILMKKSRSAACLSALCSAEDEARVARVILRETTSFGLRSYAVGKTALERRLERVATSLGEVGVKTAFLEGRALKSKLEYEDVRRIAEERGIPALEAYAILGREIGSPGAEALPRGEGRS